MSNFWHFFVTVAFWLLFLATFYSSYILAARALRNQEAHWLDVIIACVGWATIVMFYNT